jgi:hypothetical protein
MIGHKGFIAGGCFKNILNGEEAKDVDIFFEKSLDYAEALIYYENNDNYKKAYSNGKVVSYVNKITGVRIELVKAVFGTPEQIISEFDFSITKFAYYKDTEYIYDEKSENNEKAVTTYKIIHHKDFFEHLFFKRLVTGKDLKYPNSTFERMTRYIKYGYMPCRETKMNIINAIKENTNESDKVSQSLYDGLD